MNRRQKAKNLLIELDRILKYYNVYIVSDYNQEINIYEYDEDKQIIANFENDKNGASGFFVQETRELIGTEGADDEN